MKMRTNQASQRIVRQFSAHENATPETKSHDDVMLSLVDSYGQWNAIDEI